MPENPRIGIWYWRDPRGGEGCNLTIDGVDIRLDACNGEWLEKLPDPVLDGIRDAWQQWHDRIKAIWRQKGIDEAITSAQL